MKSRFLLRALAVFSVSCCLSCRKSAPPYAVNDALKTFRIEPGFHIEKFVLEPVVVSPVAMDFDENGRIYVVEDRGYPLSTDNPLGRVKLLEDTNGDGVPDKVTIFADRLMMPTGVMRWKKGILVTDAPNVWYFEDTNGDGVADVKKIVLTAKAPKRESSFPPRREIASTAKRTSADTACASWTPAESNPTKKS